MKKIFIFSISLICFLGKSQSNSPIPKSIENQKKLKWADYYFINGEDDKSITFYSENENDLSADQRRALSGLLQKKGDLSQAAKVLKPLLEIEQVSIIDYYKFSSLIPQNKKLSEE